jgi:hypothetical protein
MNHHEPKILRYDQLRHALSLLTVSIYLTGSLAD